MPQPSFGGVRLPRGTRTTLWWATVTVLILLILNNLNARRLALTRTQASAAAAAGRSRVRVAAGGNGTSMSSEGSSAGQRGEGGGAADDGDETTRPPKRRRRRRRTEAPSAEDDVTADPEDVAAEEHQAASGSRRKRSPPGADSPSSAKGAKPKPADGWPREGTTKHAEKLQRAILEHFAARNAARPGKYRACFVSLVRHSEEGLKRLVRLLENVRNEMPGMAKRYPFVAFLEHNADTDHVHERIEVLAGFEKGTKIGGRYPLAHVFPAGVILANLDEADFGRIPLHVPQQHSWAYPAHSYWGIPYRHMCRFFGVRVMLQKALEPFDYYMRLDTDSFILNPPKTTTVVPTRVMPWDSTMRFPVGGGDGGGADDDDGGSPAAAGGGDDVRIKNLVSSGELGQGQTESALGVLGLEEREVEVDLFQEMAVRGSLYGFLMIHPQTNSQFMSGMFDTYDEFVRKEVADRHAKPGEVGVLRGGGKGDGDTVHGVKYGSGPSPFHAPRGLGLHFWDNVEVVDLRLFRSRPKRPIRPMRLDEEAYAEEDENNKRDGNPAPDGEGDGGEGGQSIAAEKKDTKDRAMTALRFLDAVEQANGFYTHRWGDAEVRTLTMTLMLEQDEFLFFDTLGYQHYHNYHCPTTNDAGAAQYHDKQHPPSEDSSVEAWKPGAPVGKFLAGLARKHATALDDRSSKTSAIVARHDAVDQILRSLSQGRARIDTAMAAACTEEAQKSYGRDSKGRGSAAMNPAEHSSNNHFFWAHAWPQV